MTPGSFFRAMPRGMAVAAGVVFLLLNGLGVWQLQRLHWKQQLIADMARTEALAPVPADEALAGSQSAWRRVTLPPCHPDRLIYMHSEMIGQPGYRVLSACPLTAGGGMLIDLGFSTGKDVPVPGSFVPQGRLRPFERANMATPANKPDADDWYWRSATDMGPALELQLRQDDFLVVDLSASGIAPVGLMQGALTAPLPNRHLEYALTWFSLAWVLVAMFAAFVVQKAKRA